MSALPKPPESPEPPKLFEPGTEPGKEHGPRNYAGATAKGPPRDGDILSTGRVARLLRVAPRTVGVWVDTGSLKGYRLPGGTRDRRIHALDLVEFMLTNGMFRQLAECTVARDGFLLRCRVQDRWGQVVARVTPVGAPEAAGADWLPGEESRYVVKVATPEAFRVLVDAGFRMEDGR